MPKSPSSCCYGTGTSCSRCNRKAPTCERWPRWSSNDAFSLDKTRITNRLSSTLKEYFPQALDWLEDRDGTVLRLPATVAQPYTRQASTASNVALILLGTQSTPRTTH